MNKKIVSHLQYSWYIYVIIAVISIALWTMVFQGFLEPDNNERVAIVFYSGGWDSLELYAELNNTKGKITSQKLKEITVEQCAVNKTGLLQRVGSDMLISDLLVIEQSLIDGGTQQNITLDIPRCFYEIDQEKILTYFTDVNVNFYMVDEKAYGIYLNDPFDGQENNFENYYDGEDVFVLFFSRDSVNIDQMNGKGNIGDKAALDVTKYLLEVN